MKSLPALVRRVISPSLPVRGAWVEIENVPNMVATITVAPRAGSVG